MLLRAQSETHNVQVFLLDITFPHFLSLVLDLNRLDRVLVLEDLTILRSRREGTIIRLVLWLVAVVLNLNCLWWFLFLKKLVRSNLGFLQIIVINDSQVLIWVCLLYTSPSPRDRQKSRMPSSA